ncbi:MAG: hypothetical protein II820_05545 [Ruminiclostridium sp.]|nr:hypothetical protein [Ruminiclostridium sp.]
MRLTESRIKRVNIFSDTLADSGYVGKKRAPALLGFVYAEVFPSKETLSEDRRGQTVSSGATLILRREAGVKCGDLAGIFGERPDSRVTQVERYPGHLTVRTERL